VQTSCVTLLPARRARYRFRFQARGLAGAQPKPSLPVPDESLPASDRTVEHATCLGCGCVCDDITVVVRGERITEARLACSLGARWFGDGGVPAHLGSSGARDAARTDVAAVLARAASTLRDAARPLVYLASDVPCETQRAAVAIADVLGAALDSLTSSIAPGVLAAQRRGRTSATLGEIRNRSDVILFWGIDPAARYPRYTSRYAPDPEGLHIPEGRRGRTVLAADVGGDRGPADADARIAVTTGEEVAAIALLRVALQGRAAKNGAADALDRRMAAFAERLRGAKYLTIVADGESSAGRDPGRGEALIALAETLNGFTRCALSTLRAGGNRSGADAVMTWQTGYPMAVDFGRRAPEYRPADDAAGLLGRGEIDAALVVGSIASLPDAVRTGLARVPCVVIGPRASETPFPGAVTIDTGIAGIHERGTAVRLDEVPLPLRPALESPEVAAFRDRVGPGTPAVSMATVSGVYAGSGVAGAGNPERMLAEATPVRDASPELTVAGALAAAGRPQDSYVILRALGATLARMAGVA
jgi:formylmethanofuran dehydrogenase subunit B